MIEYPWCLHKSGGRTKTVHNADEKAAALAEGWCVDPADAVPPTREPESAPEPEPEPESRGRRGRK